LGAAAVPLASAAPALAAPAKGGHHGGDLDARVEERLAAMSTEKKIGQLFIAVGYGATVDEKREENTTSAGVATTAEIISTHHVGGLIAFAWSGNVDSIEAAAGWTAGAQRAAAEAGEVPLMIGIDEERGVVKRLPAPATALPGAMALGASRSEVHARRAARITADELAAVGFTQNYAPLCDVNVNAQNPVIGVRSVGADPELVADLASAQLREAQKRGISATVKHFPGHGDTATDSHVGLPVIDHSREELDEIDLPPFRRAVEDGVDAIMTAHIVVPALDDSGVPATLSHPILTGVLREEIGFEGVIVTDSLAMEGVRTMFGDDRVPVEAILAGADQMLMPPDLAVAIGGVRAAVESGEITAERLDASVRRILRQKARRGLLDGAPEVDPERAERKLGGRDALRAAERIAGDAATLLVEGSALPLRRGARVVVLGAGSAAVQDALVAALEDRGLEASRGAAADAAGADLAVAMTSSSSFVTPAAQVTAVKEAAATGTPVLHASLRNPYDVVHVGEVDTSIALYSDARCSLRALAGIVVGRVSPAGRLPVAIPTADGTGEAYAYGAGLG
ncbi:glycoside hydrolase family 3 protein, partial [Brachybacterium squillarum]|uniref:glycoside hydrolase family 3 protein n=1 Tax=Brachybacterium squillarum TaxID=661979 RepID=UPI0029CA9D96